MRTSSSSSEEEFLHLLLCMLLARAVLKLDARERLPRKLTAGKGADIAGCARDPSVTPPSPIFRG